jgi:hypothetical protein
MASPSSRPLWRRLARHLAVAADPRLPRRRRTRAARMAAALAERLGVISRPRRCAWCGGRRHWLLERHHPDHAAPLLVLWLCRDCHRLADNMIRDEAG